MWKKIIITGWLFLIQSVFSQGKYIITVDQSLELALKNSRLIHSSEAKVKGADGRVGESRAGLLPKISLTGRYSKLSQVDLIIPIPLIPGGIRLPYLTDQTAVRLTLQQPVFSGFRLYHSYKMSDYNAKATGEEFNKDKADLILNLKTAYWNVLKFQALAKQIDETVEQLKEHFKEIETFYRQGMATNNEVLKVRVQLSDMQVNQIDAHNAVSLAKLSLCNVMGIPLSSEIVLADSLFYQGFSLPAIEPLVAQALKNRPDVKSTEYRVKMSQSGVSLARAGWYPNLVAMVNYDYAKPNSRIFPQRNQYDETWDVTLNLQMNLWDWGTSLYQTRQAQAQLTQAEDAWKQVQDAATLEVTQSYLNLVKFVKAIEVAGLTIEQAEENYKVTSEKFKNGLALNSDLLDAETALLSAKTKYVNTLADFRIAEAKLKRAVGE
jgi:outer membrane protein